MDPIPRHDNENDPLSVSDLKRIQNLSLKGHNQELINLGVDPELKKQSLGGDGSMPLKPNPRNLQPCYSPTATCLCGGPMHHFDKSHKAWAFPDQKLYSAAEDPTRKQYSPFPGPVQSTSFSTSNLQKLYANFN